MSFKRTTQVVQRYKNEPKRCSYGRDRVGPAGLALSRRGARVTFTDLPDIMPHVEANVRRNVGEGGDHRCAGWGGRAGRLCYAAADSSWRRRGVPSAGASRRPSVDEPRRAHGIETTASADDPRGTRGGAATRPQTIYVAPAAPPRPHHSGAATRRRRYDWTGPAPAAAAGPWDHVVATDCVYHAHLVKPFLDTLDAVAGPLTTVWLA